MTQLAFYIVSDVHGYLFPTDYQDKTQRLPMGLLHTKAIIEEDSAQYKNTIRIDNGDFLQGSPIGHYLAKERESAEQLAAIYNQFVFDLGVIGNHEFNFGLNYLKDTLADLDYPVLSANILENGEPFTGHGVTYLQREGLTIGVIGLTTQYIPHWEKAEYIEGLTFESAESTLAQWLPEVRAKSDIVAVCYHGGFERDLESGAPTEALTGENEGYALLDRFHTDIDLLITGHQHREIAQVIHGVPVIQPGSKGNTVGKIVLDYHDQGVHHATAQLLTDDNPDKAVLTDELQQFSDYIEQWLDAPITLLSEDMVVEDQFKARTAPHPYLNFLNYILMEASNAPIVASALFDLSRGFKGEVTMRDVLNNYPFPNTFNVLKLSGQDIKDALEQTAEYFEVQDQEVIVNPEYVEPKPQHYNYDIWSGIAYTIKAGNPKGERITRLTHQGQPIAMHQTYEVVLNNYRAVGGGNYPMFSEDKIIKSIPTEGAQLIIDYLQAHPELDIPNVTDFKVEV